MKIWTEEDRDFVKQNYKNMTYLEMGAILGRDSRSVRYFAIKHLNIKKGSGSWCSPVNKKLVNSDYFKVFTEESCYILGFIAADGHVSKTRNRLSIGVNKRDRDRLEFIKNELSAGVTITEYRPTDSVKISIGCKTIKSNLIDLGFGELKQNIHYIFKKIPVKHHNDFIRGFFDGDGCISLYKRERLINDRLYTSVEHKVSFTNNNKKLLEEIKRIISCGRIYDNTKWGNYYTLEFASINDIKRFYSYIYDNVQNDLTVMKRKQEKFHTLFREK